MLVIRYTLARENKRRDAEPVDETYDDVYIEVVNADGKRVEKKVSKVRLRTRGSLFIRLLIVSSHRNSWTLPISRTVTSDTCSRLSASLASLCIS